MGLHYNLSGLDLDQLREEIARREKAEKDKNINVLLSSLATRLRNPPKEHELRKARLEIALLLKPILHEGFGISLSGLENYTKPGYTPKRTVNRRK